VVALTSLWNLPPEFETICRDIWTIHLSLLPNPPPAEPYLHLQDTQGETQTTTQVSVVPNTEESQTPPNGGNTSQEEDELKEFSSSESSSEGEEDEEDPEMTKLLLENSESGSSDDDAIIDPARKLSETSTRRAKKRSLLNRYDSPASNVAVLMVACWTMRIPVMCADFRKIIELHELAYLDPVRLLPTNLASHLTRYTIQMLSPHHAPGILFLHKLASRLAKVMYSSHGILTPELNAAPILWRTVRCLGGTPTLYKLTKRLAHILSLPLTLHHSLAPNLKQSSKRDPDSHKFDNVPPELAFLATCIVVLKMAYGLDGKTRWILLVFRIYMICVQCYVRLPKTSNDPACALPRLNEYIALLKNLDDADSKTKHAIFSSGTQMCVADLTEHMTDEYLDFCHRALVRPEDGKTAERNILEDYFPLAIGNSISEDNMVHDVPSYPKLPSNDLNHGDAEDAVLPGQSYTIFSALDVLGTLPEEYELVVSRASRWAGVPEEYLSSVVEKFERRVVRWWEGEKRREKEELKEE